MTSGAMYIGDPHNVAAITPSCKNLAKPKSAGKKKHYWHILSTYILTLKEFINPTTKRNKINGQINSNLIKLKARIKIFLPIFNVISCGCGQALPQLWFNRIFCGLRSLWTIPLACNTFIARTNCLRNNLIVSSERVPFAIMRRYKLFICMYVHIYINNSYHDKLTKISLILLLRKCAVLFNSLIKIFSSLQFF